MGSEQERDQIKFNISHHTVMSTRRMNDATGILLWDNEIIIKFPLAECMSLWNGAFLSGAVACVEYGTQTLHITPFTLMEILQKFKIWHEAIQFYAFELDIDTTSNMPYNPYASYTINAEQLIIPVWEEAANIVADWVALFWACDTHIYMVGSSDTPKTNQTDTERKRMIRRSLLPSHSNVCHVPNNRVFLFQESDQARLHDWLCDIKTIADTQQLEWTRKMLSRKIQKLYIRKITERNLRGIEQMQQMLEDHTKRPAIDNVMCDHLFYIDNWVVVSVVPN
jgi:hypothetical protein